MMTMDKTLLDGDRLRKRDVFLAFLAGIGFMLVYLIFSPRGLDPSLWNEMSVAARIRPPTTIFHGAWRLLAVGVLSFCGPEYVTAVLRIIGSLIGGISVFFVYLVLRQIVAALARVKDFVHWSWIAPLFAMIATVCFGAGDAMFRIISPVSPGALQFMGLILSLYLFLRFLKSGGT